MLANSRIEILEFKKISKRSLTELSKSKIFSAPTAAREQVPANYGIWADKWFNQPQAVPHGWVSSAILPANYRLSTALAKTWELPGPFSAAPRPSVRPIPHTLSPSHLSLRTRAGQAREITQLEASCPKVPEGGSGRCRFSRHCRPAMATRAGRRWKTDRSRDKLSSRPFP